MSEQADFLKNVVKSFTDVQAKATARLDTLEGDARKVLGELMEKGRVSQKDIAERLHKIAQSELIREKVRPAAEEALKKMAGPDYKERVEKLADELTKRIRDLQQRAMEFVGVSSREQVVTLAVELRKLADLLEKLAKKEQAAVEAAQTPAEQPTVAQ